MTTEPNATCDVHFTTNPDTPSTGWCVGVGTFSDDVGDSWSCPGVFPLMLSGANYSCTFTQVGICWAGNNGTEDIDTANAFADAVPQMTGISSAVLLTFPLGVAADNPLGGPRVTLAPGQYTDETGDDPVTPPLVHCALTMYEPTWKANSVSSTDDWSGVWSATADVSCDKPVGYLAIDYIDSWGDSVLQPTGRYNFVDPQAASQGDPYFQPKESCGVDDDDVPPVDVDTGGPPDEWVRPCQAVKFTWDMRTGGSYVAYKPKLFWRVRAWIAPGNLRLNAHNSPPGIVEVPVYADRVVVDSTADQRHVPQNVCNPWGSPNPSGGPQKMQCYLFMGPPR